jgi:aspartate 1-decarboxylase
MLVQLLKGKIHTAHLTALEPDYEGSLAIDGAVAEAAGLLPGERILVANSNNGQRFETYVIIAPAGSRTFALNGAAARQGLVGDVVTIMAFGLYEPAEAAAHRPQVIILDEQNEIVARK